MNSTSTKFSTNTGSIGSLTTTRQRATLLKCRSKTRCTRTPSMLCSNQLTSNSLASRRKVHSKRFCRVCCLGLLKHLTTGTQVNKRISQKRSPSSTQRKVNYCWVFAISKQIASTSSPVLTSSNQRGSTAKSSKKGKSSTANSWQRASSVKSSRTKRQLARKHPRSSKRVTWPTHKTWVSWVK